MRVKVDYESRADYLKNELRSQCMMANRLMIEDIHREANKTTPLSNGLPSDGDLREQVTKRVEGLEGIMIWQVPYASYQERGMRYDKSHVVRHYTTPGTNKYFARDAVEKVLNSKNLRHYIRFAQG